MKIKKSKLIMLVLTVFMLLGVLVLTASASDNEVITGKAGENAIYTYYPETDALVFSGEGKVDDYALPYWFADPCYIVIEEGITEIGTCFFNGVCSAVFIPETVLFIDENAFQQFELNAAPHVFPELALYYEGSSEQFEEIMPVVIYDSYTVYANSYMMSAHNHSFSESVLGGEAAEICNNWWWTDHSCSCGFIYRTLNEPLGEHIYSELIAIDTPFLCLDSGNDGYHIAEFRCKNCSWRIFKELPVEPHTLKNYQYDSLAPCRLEDGEIITTLRRSWCAVCDSEYDETEITTGPIDCEVLKWTETKVPSCKEKGEEQGTCIHCGQTVTRAIDEKPHDLRYVVIKEATCKEEGEALYDCNKFGCSYSGESIVLPTVDHKPSEWYTSSNVSCTADGEESRSCVWCGERIETRKTEDKLGHSFGEWVVMISSTCIFQGWEYKDCARCGTRETRELPLTPCYDSDDNDPYCDYCGNELKHIDEDNDGICDFCTSEFEHRDYDGDGYCDWCGYEFEHKMTFIERIIDFFNSIVNWFRGLFGFA